MKITTSSAVAEALKVLRQHEVTYEQAVTSLRYKNHVGLPYGITVVDLIELMEKKGLIKISRKRGQLLRDASIRVIEAVVS